MMDNRGIVGQNLYIKDYAAVVKNRIIIRRILSGENVLSTVRSNTQCLKQQIKSFIQGCDYMEKCVYGVN